MQTYRTVINRPNRLGVFAGLTGLLLTSGLLLSFAAYGETMEEKLQAQIQQEKQEQAAAEEKRKQAEVAKQKADKEAAEKAAAAKAAAKKEKERKAAAEKKAQEEADRKAAARAQAKREAAAAAAKEASAKSSVATKQPLEPVMEDIPAGTFTMGCDDERDNVEGGCYDGEKPAHKVTLNGFQMAKTETTVGQYMACVDAGACPQPEWQEKGSEYNIKTGTNDLYKKFGNALSAPNYPVVGVSWDNAKAYAEWLSKETGKSYRLPTEAEWEYAARGGTDTAYPWGNAIGKGNANCDNSSCGDKFEYTAPVGSFAANGYGLNDMNGNVWEWCQDWYGDYSSSSVSNPKGVSSGTYRVLRGGAWDSYAQFVRSASRNYGTPGSRNYNIGFRLVLP
jgi:formylglycine-generating enzyme required for sulfatase activity